MPRSPKPCQDYAPFVQKLAHLSRVVAVDELRGDDWKEKAVEEINSVIRRLTRAPKAATKAAKAPAKK
jgi:hypothetical protein